MKNLTITLLALTASLTVSAESCISAYTESLGSVTAAREACSQVILATDLYTFNVNRDDNPLYDLFRSELMDQGLTSNDSDRLRRTKISIAHRAMMSKYKDRTCGGMYAYRPEAYSECVREAEGIFTLSEAMRYDQPAQKHVGFALTLEDFYKSEAEIREEKNMSETCGSDESCLSSVQSALDYVITSRDNRKSCMDDMKSSGIDAIFNNGEDYASSRLDILLRSQVTTSSLTSANSNVPAHVAACEDRQLSFDNPSNERCVSFLMNEPSLSKSERALFSRATTSGNGLCKDLDDALAVSNDGVRSCLKYVKEANTEAELVSLARAGGAENCFDANVIANAFQTQEKEDEFIQCVEIGDYTAKECANYSKDIREAYTIGQSVNTEFAREISLEDFNSKDYSSWCESYGTTVKCQAACIKTLSPHNSKEKTAITCTVSANAEYYGTTEFIACTAQNAEALTNPALCTMQGRIAESARKAFSGIRLPSVSLPSFFGGSEASR